MIKKFTEFLFESGGNVYQTGTPFSNGHRSRTKKNGFLQYWHYMIDIDSVIVNSNDEVVGIIETKKQRPSETSELKDILKEETPQKKALLEISRLLSTTAKFQIFVEIESESIFYWISREKVGSEYKSFHKDEFLNLISEKNLRIVSTDNKIFVEFRIDYGKTKIKAISLRNEGSMEGKFFSMQFANRLGVPLVDVDDTGENIIFSQNGKIVGQVPNILNPLLLNDVERKMIEQQWEDVYKKMGLWN